MQQRRDSNFSPTIYVQNLQPNLIEAFIILSRLFSLNLLQNGFPIGFAGSDRRRQHLRWITKEYKTFQRLRNLGLGYGLELKGKTKVYDRFFIDYYIRRDRFGVYSFKVIDNATKYCYQALTDDGFLVFILPPAMENLDGAHKIVLDDYIKSILYANGFEIKKLVPFFDTYARITEKNWGGKASRGLVSFLGLATKSRTYKIPCLDASKEALISEDPKKYIDRFCSWGNDIFSKLMRWKTFARLIKW